MVDVLVPYASGTARMLEACLGALRRHDAGEPMAVRVLAGDEAAFEEARPFAVDGTVLESYDVSGSSTSSGRHAALLDKAVEGTKGSYVLSLDSDCFPVADGWLSGLMAEGKDVSGILWPWVPAPDGLGPNTIESRMRRNRCWNNTQVACQLLRTEMVRDMGLKFADPKGDDTNFGLMDKVRAAGLAVGGYMPTRCALPDGEGFDPEFNRYVCVVYGDKVYHHGGASRELRGEMKVDKALFGKARQRVLDENGAEWMLEAGGSHEYRMDDEEKVAQFNMDMIYRDALTFLKGHGTLFGGWI